jgi:hypothetical protein
VVLCGETRKQLKKERKKKKGTTEINNARKIKKKAKNDTAIDRNKNREA